MDVLQKVKQDMNILSNVTDVLHNNSGTIKYTLVHAPYLLI